MATGKICTGTIDKSTVAGMQECVDAIKADAGCGAGNGYFGFDPNTGGCMCCTYSDAATNTQDSADYNLYKMHPDCGIVANGHFHFCGIRVYGSRYNTKPPFTAVSIDVNTSGIPYIVNEIGDVYYKSSPL